MDSTERFLSKTENDYPITLIASAPNKPIANSKAMLVSQPFRCLVPTQATRLFIHSSDIVKNGKNNELIAP